MLGDRVTEELGTLHKMQGFFRELDVVTDRDRCVYVAGEPGPSP